MPTRVIRRFCNEIEDKHAWLMRIQSLLLSPLLVLSLTSCDDLVDPPEANPETGTPVDPSADPLPVSNGITPPGQPLADCATPGPRLLRRLTASQYRNSIIDIFQDEGAPEQIVLQDPAVLGFNTDSAEAVVANLDADVLMTYAEEVALWARESNKLGRFTTCTDAGDANCRRAFIESLGLAAHREPLPEARVTAYDQLFDDEDDGNFAQGQEVVLTAMLQSPFLIYRRELGVKDQASGEFTLGAFELASELSYLLTDRPPDAELLQAARDNRLSTQQDIDREAERLLLTSQARGTLTAFVEGWLEINRLFSRVKDNAQVDMTPELREAMLEETRTLFVDVFFSDGSVEDLMAADHTFVDQRLADLYEMDGVNGGDLQQVDLAGTTRFPGVIGHAAFLATHALPDNSSPVQRGKVVRERLLCQDLPEPPSDVDTALQDPSGFRNNRERYEQHSSDASCKGCHEMMDPVGFTLDHYDGFGRRRELESGVAIDVTGSLLFSPENTDIPLDGAESLVSYLSTTDSVRSCMVRYWSYFAHGKDEWASKECNNDSIRREAESKGYTLKSVLLGILHAPTFTRRVLDE